MKVIVKQVDQSFVSLIRQARLCSIPVFAAHRSSLNEAALILSIEAVAQACFLLVAYCFQYCGCCCSDVGSRKGLGE